MTRLFKVTVNGREYDVAVLEVTPGSGVAGAAPALMPASTAAEPSAAPSPAAVRAASPSAASAEGDEVAQMGGIIVAVEVKVGQTVAKGDSLLVLEAMKMKNHLLASHAGTVTRILVAPGDAVEGGQPLLTIR